MKKIIAIGAAVLFLGAAVPAVGAVEGVPYSKGSVVSKRAHNGHQHILRTRLGGPSDPDFAATRDGPRDWQGHVKIGDRYLDSLNYDKYRRCESGNDPRAYNPDDTDGGGERFGYYQFAEDTWHYAGGYWPRTHLDPYDKPWDAPRWYQTYRVKRLFQKEFVKGPDRAWRYPPLTHVGSCRDELKDSPHRTRS